MPDVLFSKEAVNTILSPEEQIICFVPQECKETSFMLIREKWEKLPDMKTLLVGE